MFQLATPQILLPQMVREEIFYQGQLGVPGSDVPRGLRTSARSLTLYVDPGHNGATAAADGTNPENPCLTLNQAVTNLVGFATANVESFSHSTIIVSGDLDESLSITDYTAYPSYVTIVGAGPSPWGVVWENSDAATPIAVLGAVGWRVTGFRFYVPSAAAAVVIPCTQAPYGANAIGIRTVVDNCYFDGSVYTGLYGIDLHGAPYNPNIRNNMFGFLNGGASFGIVSTNTGFADSYRPYISDNWFHESDGGIDASLNVGVITGNIFQTGGVTTMTTPLDLRGGTRGENTVVGNYLGGDYSNAGGYYANAGNPGNWVGNFAQDVAEAEVGDNGITVLPPAA